MHGFSVVISLNGELHFPEFRWKKPFGFQSEFVKRRLECSDSIIEQFTQKKLIEQKLWIDTVEYFFVAEGIITNLLDLYKTYSVPDSTSLISKLILEKEFFKKFTGHFCGFVVNKFDGTYTAFNNHTGTKKLFYFQNRDFILYSTDLYTLHEALKTLKIKTSPDIDAAYLLLTNGFMLGDLTLISEIKQVTAGQYAAFSNGSFAINSYYHLSEIEPNNDNYAEIIDNIDYLFSKSIDLEFNLDKINESTSISTLSGGLDSRMTTLIAHKNGYYQELINFSQKGYADEVIASEISKKYNLKLHYAPLQPEGLCNIDDVVSINDGLTIYTGSSHVFEAFKKQPFHNNGIVHTGMIGDAVLGSFLSSTNENPPKTYMGLYSTSLFDKTENIIQQHVSNYRNEELYKFYTRAFCGANNGFHYYDLIGESSSAFLEPEFMSYLISVPIKFKYNARLYIDWIKTKHPDFANFIWESIGCKPTNNKLVRTFYRYKRAVIKRLPYNSMWKNYMTPEQLWYDQNSNVSSYLDEYFGKNIHRAEFNVELRNDLIELYRKGNITEKAQALTLLAAYKLLF